MNHVILEDAKERAEICGIPESEVRQGVLGIMLSKSLEESKAQAQKIYDRGQWPKTLLKGFTKTPNGRKRGSDYGLLL